MQLPLQDFTALVRLQSAAVVSSARSLIDLSVGSVLRALLEANASVGLWIQWLIVEVLSTTRAATSRGEDLDSWVRDFGLSRLPGVQAQVVLRFSRETPGLRATIPLGALVRTGVTVDAQAFEVIADPARVEWTGSGYAVTADRLTIDVAARAVAAGRAGNVQPGVLRLLSTAIAGVDAVTNEFSAFGGLDAETDDALRLRFGGYMDSRVRATAQAITFAIQSVRQGVQFKIAEGVDAAGYARAGHFTVVLDDGSGAPDDQLLSQVSVAIEPMRPLGSTFSVRRPGLVGANVSMRIVAPPVVRPIVVGALGGYLSTLPIGGALVLSRLVQVAHEADDRVLNVSEVTINGRAGDLVAGPFDRIVPGGVSVLL